MKETRNYLNIDLELMSGRVKDVLLIVLKTFERIPQTKIRQKSCLNLSIYFRSILYAYNLFKYVLLSSPVLTIYNSYKIQFFLVTRQF